MKPNEKKICILPEPKRGLGEGFVGRMRQLVMQERLHRMGR